MILLQFSLVIHSSKIRRIGLENYAEIERAIVSRHESYHREDISWVKATASNIQIQLANGNTKTIDPVRTIAFGDRKT